MKFINNSLYITFTTLLLCFNEINTFVIRNIDPTLEEANNCVVEKECGENLSCIARCYNVPNPDYEAIRRTVECQRTCNAKYPDPSIELELLTQCYRTCIVDEYYVPYSERITPEEIEEERKKNEILYNNNNNNNENIATSSSNENENKTNIIKKFEESKPKISDETMNKINNNNNNNITSTTNTNTNTNANANNNTMNNTNDNTNNTDNNPNNTINYIEENSGKETRKYFSIVLTELFILFTILYKSNKQFIKQTIKQSMIINDDDDNDDDSIKYLINKIHFDTKLLNL
ncbi:hypothetical protein BCR32DRAFT_297731 [Anaeromyces robustus]|uniref:Extracellular membrane protein CFEM domain-containing protein n=1 Tax=Anaeromyces robustus TaxID=1754192 RepID=A0A1Y1VVS8_9FUNG|nr:hypothetical protein BCR32DRAFT_297731 [Anaeromyces robustus]|eukprot:ORX65402.1 hypothetical protein BCR32DRAFT_297731 [Anaeromyces robustus]